MKNVLIVNAVPVNNGDAALVFALYEAIKERGYNVTIATHRFELVRHYYPNIAFVRDLLDYSFIKKSRIFKYLLIPLSILFIRAYREADVVVGAPGGYINSYYGIFDKLYVLFACKLLGKRTAVYSQSVGPLNCSDQKLFSFFMKFLDLVLVRDLISYETATTLAGHKDRIIKTEDAAFLLRPNCLSHNKYHKVAVSVRDWKFDSRDVDKYYILVAELVKTCLRNGYFVEFLSTCQGVPAYVDDSIVAEKIITTHLSSIDGIIVKAGRYSFDEFRNVIKEYDFIIGTRLHMCILGMINGIPAYNISYEAKGKECYNYLGIPELSIDYNSECSLAVSNLERFIDRIDEHKKYIKQRMMVCHADALKYLEQFCRELDNS